MRRAVEAEQKGPTERPNILYAVSTGCWGPVTPPGKPLPLVQILDETAAGGFNGVRLTGFPDILKQNNMSLEQYGDELASRGCGSPPCRSAGNTTTRPQHEDIRRRAREALAAHKQFGATAMVFFPPSPVPEAEEADALGRMHRLSQ